VDGDEHETTRSFVGKRLDGGAFAATRIVTGVVDMLMASASRSPDGRSLRLPSEQPLRDR
jgi:hypothetical protein